MLYGKYVVLIKYIVILRNYMVTKKQYGDFNQLYGKW